MLCCGFFWRANFNTADMVCVIKSFVTFAQSDEKLPKDGLIHKLSYHYGSSDAEQSFPCSASFITMYKYNITYSCVYKVTYNTHEILYTHRRSAVCIPRSLVKFIGNYFFLCNFLWNSLLTYLENWKKYNLYLILLWPFQSLSVQFDKSKFKMHEVRQMWV